MRGAQYSQSLRVFSTEGALYFERDTNFSDVLVKGALYYEGT